MLEAFFSTGRIALCRGDIFDQHPAPLDLDDLRVNQRIEGMLLGLAVGDALGHSTEWKYDSDTRHREFGTIVDHVAAGNIPGGRISDDTQFSFWTLETLLARGSFDFETVARCFVERRDLVVGMGRNTAAALSCHAERFRTGQPPPHQCAGDPEVDGRGNGTVMRLAPLVLPHLRHPSPGLYGDLLLAALITHSHPAALAATVALGHMLWELLRRPVGRPPQPEWWLNEFVRIASQLEPTPPRYGPGRPPVPELLRDFDGSLWAFIEGPVLNAWRRGMSIRDACSLQGFGSGADCMQSVPAILYILMHHADSFESAIISAVNDTKDNDTIASVIGALTGALHGRRAIRQKWLDGISSHSLGDVRGASDRAVIERVARHAAQKFVTGSVGQQMLDF